MIAIGIDIGGTSIKGGFVDQDGKLIEKISFASIDLKGLDKTKIIEDLAAIIAENLDKYKDVVGVGIGCPGCINSKTGVCEYSNNLDWHDLPIASIISKKIGLPVKMSNDANVAMLGEAKFGIGKGYKNLVLLTLGTGVGGGLFLDGKLYEGNEGKGAELGHAVIHAGGEQCTCGMKGCLEAYASVTALNRITRKAMEEHKDSLMWKLSPTLEEVNGKTAFEASKLGDEAALKVVDEYEDNLAIGLINYCNIFRPEAIVLGGGLSGQKEYLTKPLEKRLAALNYGFSKAPVVKVLTTELGNDAGILGAAALVL